MAAATLQKYAVIVCTTFSQWAPGVFNLDQKVQSQTFFSDYYDAKQVRISQEKHLLTGFPLSYC